MQPVNRETMPGPLEFMVVASDLDMNMNERNMDVANITIYGMLLFINMLPHVL